MTTIDVLTQIRDFIEAEAEAEQYTDVHREQITALTDAIRQLEWVERSKNGESDM